MATLKCIKCGVEPTLAWWVKGKGPFCIECREKYLQTPLKEYLLEKSTIKH